MLIRTGDTVRVITGANRGSSASPTEARVISVNRETGKALVEGVNRVYKHVRRSQKHPQGGRLSMEMPVQLSNLMFVCPTCRKASRLGARMNEKDGSKERFCKKCGAGVGQISPARKKAVKK